MPNQPNSATYSTPRRFLRTLGFAAATLWVLEGNTRAISFYHRTGWSEDGHHWNTGYLDMILYQLRESRYPVRDEDSPHPRSRGRIACVTSRG